MQPWFDNDLRDETAGAELNGGGVVVAVNEVPGEQYFGDVKVLVGTCVKSLVRWVRVG